MNKNRRQGDRFGRDGGVILLLLVCRVVTGLYGEVVVKTVGVVAMVNSGPDSNGSQLFITTVMASWLDGEHDVFGKVIEGMDTVYAIEGGAGTYSGKPRKKLIIDDLDEMPKSEWEEGSRSSTSAL